MNKKKRNISQMSNNDYSKTVNPPLETEQDSPVRERRSNFRLGNYLKSHIWLVSIFVFLSLGALGATLKYLEVDASRQILNGQLNSNGSRQTSLLNTVNPFLGDPEPTLPPKLSKEYIYAGGKMLAVEDANTVTVPPADLAVWRPDTTSGTGTWYVQGSQGSQQTFIQWGANTDLPAPGDFDGDGKTDFSVFRPSTGYWYVQRSSDTTLLSYQFGQNGDKLAHADYDGDGRTDVAVFRSDSWYILRSSDNGFTGVAFGYSTDIPASADYDGMEKRILPFGEAAIRRFTLKEAATVYFLRHKLE